MMGLDAHTHCRMLPPPHFARFEMCETAKAPTDLDPSAHTHVTSHETREN